MWWITKATNTKSVCVILYFSTDTASLVTLSLKFLPPFIALIERHGRGGGAKRNTQLCEMSKEQVAVTYRGHIRTINANPTTLDYEKFSNIVMSIFT